MALIILGLVLVGFYMKALPYSPEKLDIYAVHKSFGLLILWMVGLRILWRLWTKPPAPQKNHESWEKILAHIAHITLYVAMIGMPLTGWLMSSAGEYPVPFFGIKMPDLVSKNPDLAKLMNSTHTIIGYVLILTIFLHAAGALKHHFIDRDETLIRMMTEKGQRFLPYLIVIVLILFALGAARFVLPKIIQMQEKVVQDVSTSNDTSEVVAAKNQPNEVTEWFIQQDESHIEFSSSVYGTEFTGQFQNFSGQIYFDPDNLEKSTVNITIDITSAETGDDSRDTQMQKSEWFDTSNYPEAKFISTSFKRLSDKQYEAIGDLRIKEVTQTVRLPFTLDITNEGRSEVAQMTSDITLDRQDFGLGGDQWSNGSDIGFEVPLRIKVIAKNTK